MLRNVLIDSGLEEEEAENPSEEVLEGVVIRQSERLTTMHMIIRALKKALYKSKAEVRVKSFQQFPCLLPTDSFLIMLWNHHDIGEDVGATS